MKAITKLITFWALILVAAPLSVGQTGDQEKKDLQKQEAEQDVNQPTPQDPAAEVWGPQIERGVIEFGGRGFFGDVYGRPDLSFEPNLRQSKLNEYSDIRDNVLVRRARIHLDDLFGHYYYLDYQTQNSFYRNQSHLLTIGQYDKVKFQVRYDQIPHIYTNTARTSFVETSPGVFEFPLLERLALQTASSTGTAATIANTLPPFIQTNLVPTQGFVLPWLQRSAVTGLFSYKFTPDWEMMASYTREHEDGHRPIGLILNSSPSASASSQPTGVTGRQSPGTGAELPEPIDYFNNTVKAMTEYGRERWAVQLGYNGSFFENNIGELVFDNPFATADLPVQIIAPGVSGCPVTPSNCSISATPARGRVDLYPDNTANYLYFAGAVDLTKHIRFMAMVNPGWLRQNDPFVPYTINSAITGLDPLPTTSLHGEKQTLAMNLRLVGKIGHVLELEGNYRHYDYNNNTAVFDLTPIQGDTIGANAAKTAQAAPTPEDTVGRSNPGYNRKTLELDGTWYFAKRSQVRLGWEGEWMDRSFRDVDHTFESTFLGSVDWSPVRDLLFRVSGRHGNRDPELYQDPTASDPVTEDPIACTSTSVVFTEEQRCHRRFDEAARVLDRVDAQVQWDWRAWSFGGSFQTIQQDFNQRGGVNSPTPLNFVSPTPGFASPTEPYYLYGALKDLSWTYSFDTSYTFSPAVSAFIEYTHEDYHKRMISRNRTPISTGTIATCAGSSSSTSPAGCDTANNDWESTYKDVFDTYAFGLDTFLWKHVWFSPYYSLAAGKGNVFTRALGDPAILVGPNKFLLTGGSAPQDYPETTTRIHEVGAVFKYKINSNWMPKIEYRYQQFDNQDYQTTPMTQYMGCIGAGTVTPANPPCPFVGANLGVLLPSQFYPYFVVGDTSAARYLFLGADQPSYKAHVLTFTLEYHF